MFYNIGYFLNIIVIHKSFIEKNFFMSYSHINIL